MATRFYFTTDAATFSPTNTRGTWGDTTQLPTHDYDLGRVKAGTNNLISLQEFVDTTNHKVLLHRHVSGPLAGGSVAGGSGSFQHVQARQENAANNNLTVQIHIYFTVGDTDTVRHTYLNSFTGATEFATAMTILSYTSAVPTAGTIEAGDRLVIEIGYNAANTTVDATGSVRIGGTAADLATSGTTGVTTDSAWFEFLGTGSDAAVAPGPVTHEAEGTRPTTVTLTGTAARDVFADGTRATTVSLSADALITKDVDGTLAVTAGRTADATATHTVDGERVVTADRTATAVADHTVDGDRTVTVGLTADATVSGQVAIDGTLAVTATRTATVTATHTVDGSLPVTAGRTADVAVTHTIDGALPVTAGRTADATTDVIVTIDGTRPVTATLSAAATATHTIGGDLTVTAGRTADATAVYVLDGALTVTAGRTAAVTYATGTAAQMAATAVLTAAADVVAAYEPALVSVEAGSVAGATEGRTVTGDVAAYATATGLTE